MFLMHGDAKYIDVLERVLYNAALSGISMKGELFFYPNPLESTGQHARSPWFPCACCPSNVARFIPSVPGYTYAHKDGDVYVNLFISGTGEIETAGNKITLTQQTRYPWQGSVKIGVEPEKSDTFAVYVRIPGWAQNQPVPSDLYKFLSRSRENAAIKVNGKRISPETENGFARIERRWRKGDTIELDLPMPVRRIIAHEEIADDRGKVALQRGPIVFCLEWPDNDGKVLNLVIGDDTKLRTEHRPDLLGGVTVITGKGRTVKRTLDGDIVAHRGRGQMTVWPARELDAARPGPADTLTYKSKTTASFVHVSLDAIKDQILPKNSADASASQLDFWPHKDTTEWLKFEWGEKHKISSVKVYWFDDTGRGACHLPESWKVLHRDSAGRFAPVKATTPYGLKKDTFNKVDFDPVRTDAIKIEITLQKDWSAGVQEVVIE
jgi:hypothetical protein